MKLFFLFWLFLIPCLAEGQIDITLDASRKMALHYSRQAAIASKTADKLRYERKSIRGNFFPKFSLSGLIYYSPNDLNESLKGGYLPTYMTNADGSLTPNVMVDPATGNPIVGPNGTPLFTQYAFLPDMNFSFGFEGVTKGDLMLEQPIYMGGKIRSAYQMAQIGESIAIENIRLQRQNVILEVDNAFWMLAEVKEKLMVVSKLVTLLDEVKRQINNGVETGLKTRNDLLKVQVKLNEALLNRQKANNGVELARMNLCRIIGLPLTTPVNLVDSLSALCSISADILTNGSLNRPEIAIIEKDIELKDGNVRMVRSEFLPQIVASASYGHLGGLTFNGTSTDYWSFSAIGSVKIPVFHWGEGRNKIRAAQLEQEMGQLQLQQTSELITLEVAQNRFSLMDAITRVNMAQAALLQADENVRMNDDRYSLGLEPVSGLLDAQTQWQQIWYALIEAKLQLRLTETAYLKALGSLTVDY